MYELCGCLKRKKNILILNNPVFYRSAHNDVNHETNENNGIEI